MPPEASVGTRPSTRRTASRKVSGSILSSSSRVAPACSAGSIWSIRSTSQMISCTPASTARRTASPTLPATSTWLSLIIAASHNPMRWFCPPPMRTAYFSRKRKPGMVLRVSRRTASVSPIASTYSRTMVAMPERCWTVFKALRSAVSMARALPSSRIRSVPGATRSPSSTSRSIVMSGSRWRKKASAIGRPATVIGSRESITPEKRASAGMTLSEVTSRPPPSRVSPRSSAKVSATNRSRSKPVSSKVILSPLDANAGGLLVNEARDHVAIAAAHLHLGT